MKHMDLSKAPDHPAVLTRANAERQAASGNLGTSAVLNRWADDLALYQARRGVTFAALDNDALANVREAYERTQASDWRTTDHEVAIDDLIIAVQALLGLDQEG